MNTYGATKTNLSALIHNAESLFLTFKAMISIFTIPEACTMQNPVYIVCFYVWMYVLLQMCQGYRYASYIVSYLRRQPESAPTWPSAVHHAAPSLSGEHIRLIQLSIHNLKS